MTRARNPRKSLSPGTLGPPRVLGRSGSDGRGVPPDSTGDYQTKPRHEAAKILKLDGPQARARRDLAQARLLETKERLARGELILADTANRAWSAEIAAARAYLLSLPTAWCDRIHRAATLAGEAGVGAVERELRDAVHHALRELAAGAHHRKAASRKRANGRTRRDSAPAKLED